MMTGGKLSFLGESFPNPSKNRLRASFMGHCPKPHKPLKRLDRNFICLRRKKMIYPRRNDSFCKWGSRGIIPLAGCGTESYEKGENNG